MIRLSVNKKYAVKSRTKKTASFLPQIQYNFKKQLQINGLTFWLHLIQQNRKLIMLSALSRSTGKQSCGCTSVLSRKQITIRGRSQHVCIFFGGRGGWLSKGEFSPKRAIRAYPYGIVSCALYAHCRKTMTQARTQHQNKEEFRVNSAAKSPTTIRQNVWGQVRCFLPVCGLPN